MINRDDYLQLVDQVKPHQKYDELYLLLQLLEERNIKTVVEIGTGCGGTAAIFKSYFPTVISVDISEIEDARKLADKYGFKYIIGDSRDKVILEKVLQLLCTKFIDFLFIDGSHSYENVKKDFELWSPYAKNIALHDIVWTRVDPNVEEKTVWKLWYELREKYGPNVREIICSTTDGRVEHSGIGVIWQMQ